MTKRMLIDATHPEETRVVVVDGNRVEELDLESAARKQLKGNIYLAKVTRVEPSLQAAFVDYGGNRHGFLAFSEIHPDYYQIPVSDREALVAEEEDGADDGEETTEEEAETEAKDGGKAVETVGGDDIDEAEERRTTRNYRRYKIQEVIKRRQILLVQVVKEERGNKGAALTTYLSLAGRYCVLTPNTARGGGISRKISNPNDRKRLKGFISGFKIPSGIAVIVRTAGAERSKSEIKRDYEYLLKLWSNIRELTLKSTAPALIHEEANLIKRAIRDLYARDIDEILVEGDEGYRIAKDLMKVLIPSHAKKVQPYKEPNFPLFHKYKVESQLDQLNSPVIQLKSGGYIVISPTEALVSIDVNSGRATRERNIEETALKTNLEAADEIARQLRLRDLAGLIVVDFIDMDHARNQNAVERRLKDAMRSDRARIQIGRISHFGLLELSRQRLRPSIGEKISDPCLYCGGTGVRRSTDSTALHVLRGIEEEGIVGRSGEIEVFVPTDVALYILNKKREALADIEQRFGFSVTLSNDDTLIPPNFRIEREKTARREATAGTAAAEGEAVEEKPEGEPKGKKRRRRSKRDEKAAEAPEETAEVTEDGGEAEKESEAAAADAEPEKKSSRRRRGRRGGRRRSRKSQAEQSEQSENAAAVEAAPETEETAAGESMPYAADEAAPEAEITPPAPRKRRRRKSAKSEAEPIAEPAETAAEIPAAEMPDVAAPMSEPALSGAAHAETEAAPSIDTPPEAATEMAAEPAETETPEVQIGNDNAAENVVVMTTSEKDSDKSERRGWWQRLME